MATLIDEKREVLRDHLEVCLKHFRDCFNARIPRRKRGRLDAILPLTKFLGVSDQTAARLMDPDMEHPLPRGEVLIKVYCYMDLHGYKVIEFENMKKVLRNFAELIGFSVLSPKEACELLNYSITSQLYQVLWEREPLSGERQELMWAIWKKRRCELDHKKQEAFTSSCLNLSSKPTAPVLKPPAEQQVLVAQPSTPAFVLVAQGLLAMFEGGVAENLSALDGQSRSTILQLSAHLSTLSSKLMVDQDT